MRRTGQTRYCVLFIAANLSLAACQLHRPTTTQNRTIEPQVLEPQLTEQPGTVAKSPDAFSIRLLPAESRGNIGRRVLHRNPDGELTEDPVWRWSSPPNRYLDTALHLEVAANPKLRLVEAGNVSTIVATVLSWDLESNGGVRLVGEVEFQVTGTDRVVHTQVIRGSEPVSGELPGDLAAASGRLMHSLAAEGLRRMLSEL
jgi:hypothetical protein